MWTEKLKCPGAKYGVIVVPDVQIAFQLKLSKNLSLAEGGGIVVLLEGMIAVQFL